MFNGNYIFFNSLIKMDINGQIHCKNNNDLFLKKFAGRIQKIGSGGIKDIISHNQFMINENVSNNGVPIVISDNSKNMYKRMMNQYNSMNFDSYKKYRNYRNRGDIDDFVSEVNNDNHQNINSVDTDIKSQNLQNNNENSFQNSYQNDYINNSTNNYTINNINNSQELIPNTHFPQNTIQNYSYNQDIDSSLESYNNIYTIENERSYQPYSLREYKKIMESFRKDKFGGLGANINSKDWKEREIKVKREKKFDNVTYKNFSQKMRGKIKRLASPKKVELQKIGEQIINSKRYKSFKYGKGLMLNKVRDKIIKEKKIKAEKEKLKKLEKERDLLLEQQQESIDKSNSNIYQNIIHEAPEDYENKLLELKSSLI